MNDVWVFLLFFWWGYIGISHTDSGDDHNTGTGKSMEILFTDQLDVDVFGGC